MQDSTLYERLEKLAKEKGLEIFKISAATGEGVKELMHEVAKVLKTLPKEQNSRGNYSKESIQIRRGRTIYNYKKR